MGRRPGSLNKPKAAKAELTGASSPKRPKRKRQPTSKARQSQTALSDDEDSKAKSGSSALQWDANPQWTHQIIQYLTDNTQFRRKLFSDSTRDANNTGRRKQQAKDQKIHMHAMLAGHVFQQNSDAILAADYAVNPIRFAKSVGQRLQRLKKLYGEYVKELGETGAGLHPDEVTLDSDVYNKIDEIRTNFPFWDALHSFWRELPNYNPVGVSNSTTAIKNSVDLEVLISKHHDGGEMSGTDSRIPDIDNINSSDDELGSGIDKGISPEKSRIKSQLQPSPNPLRRSPRTPSAPSVIHLSSSPTQRKATSTFKKPNISVASSSKGKKQDALMNFRDIQTAEHELSAKKNHDRHIERVEWIRLQNAKLKAKEERSRLEMEERRQIRALEMEERRRECQEERKFELEKMQLQYNLTYTNPVRATSTSSSSSTSFIHSPTLDSQQHTWSLNPSQHTGFMNVLE